MKAKELTLKEYVVIGLIIIGLFIITNTNLFSEQTIEQKPSAQASWMTVPIITYDADYTFPYTLPESLMVITAKKGTVGAFISTMDSTILYEAWKKTAVIITSTTDSSRLILSIGHATNESTRTMAKHDSINMITAGTYYWDFDAGYVRYADGTESTTKNTMPLCNHFSLSVKTLNDSTGDTTYYFGKVIRDRH